MKSSSPRSVPFAALLLATVAPAALAQSAFISLNRAADFAVLGGNLNLHNVAVHGDAGVAANGSISVAGASELYGDLYMGAGATSSIGGVFTGTVHQPHDVASALADSITAAQAAAGLTPDYVVSSVSGPLIFASTGLQTVVNVTGDLNLSGGDSLYFTGSPNHKFILNVFGNFTMGGSSVIGGASGSGIGADDILVNVVGSGNKITTKVDNIIHGTILAPQRQFEMHSVNGAVIGGSLEMKLMSDSTVDFTPFVAVPEPSGASLVATAGLLLCARRRR